MPSIQQGLASIFFVICLLFCSDSSVNCKKFLLHHSLSTQRDIMTTIINSAFGARSTQRRKLCISSEKPQNFLIRNQGWSASNKVVKPTKNCRSTEICLYIYIWIRNFFWKFKINADYRSKKWSPRLAKKTMPCIVVDCINVIPPFWTFFNKLNFSTSDECVDRPNLNDLL